jgi:hypothetical protein
LQILFQAAKAREAAALLSGGKRVRYHGLEEGDGCFDLKVR